MALHEHYADADCLEYMARQADESCTRVVIDRFFDALARAGVVRPLGQAILQLHPALTGYLRSTEFLTAPVAKLLGRASG